MGVPNLQKILNSLETSVRNLTDLNVERNSYGTLLISIIFDRIPNELRIIISRNFKNDVWDLRNLIDIFKLELFSRKRCFHWIFHWTLIAKSFAGKRKITAQKMKFSIKSNARPRNCVYCNDEIDATIV